MTDRRVYSGGGEFCQHSSGLCRVCVCVVCCFHSFVASILHRLQYHYGWLTSILSMRNRFTLCACTRDMCGGKCRTRDEIVSAHSGHLLAWRPIRECVSLKSRRSRAFEWEQSILLYWSKVLVVHSYACAFVGGHVCESSQEISGSNKSFSRLVFKKNLGLLIK